METQVDVEQWKQREKKYSKIHMTGKNCECSKPREREKKWSRIKSFNVQTNREVNILRYRFN